MLSFALEPTVEEFIESQDEVQILIRHWRPETPPRAAVIICHGVNSHSGQYGWAAQQFVKAGFAVTALDLRGRGKSEGERYYIETINDYVADLGRAIGYAKARDPNLKQFLLGHSAGGVVSCSYVLDHPDEVDGLICESFAFQVYAPAFALSVVKGLSHVAPHAHVLRLKNEDFSRDPDWVRELNEDPLIENEVQPSQTVAALVRADERLLKEFRRITLPLLILHGTADKATRPDGSQEFFDHAGSADKQLILYEDYYHDLLNDLGRERVMADIVGWIDARLPAEQPLAAPILRA